MVSPLFMPMVNIVLFFKKLPWRACMVEAMMPRVAPESLSERIVRSGM